VTCQCADLREVLAVVMDGYEDLATSLYALMNQCGIDTSDLDRTVAEIQTMRSLVGPSYVCGAHHRRRAGSDHA